VAEIIGCHLLLQVPQYHASMDQAVMAVVVPKLRCLLLLHNLLYNLHLLHSLPHSLLHKLLLLDDKSARQQVSIAKKCVRTLHKHALKHVKHAALLLSSVGNVLEAILVHGLYVPLRSNS
jgi:hypothetical protein